MQMAGPRILQFGLESCQIFFHQPNWNHTYKLEPLCVRPVAVSYVVRSPPNLISLIFNL